MRGLCHMVLLDAFDRKVTREFFVDLLNDVQCLQSDMTRLEVFGALRACLLDLKPDVVPEYDKSIAEALTGHKQRRIAFADKLGKIAECPTTDDKVH